MVTGDWGREKGGGRERNSTGGMKNGIQEPFLVIL
jgi:hypothetical protein